MSACLALSLVGVGVGTCQLLQDPTNWFGWVIFIVNAAATVTLWRNILANRRAEAELMAVP